MAISLEARRRGMVDEIRAEIAQTRYLLHRDQLGPALIAALLEVPRHEFVPLALASRAYDNEPLPIGVGQTISQPYIVAAMTALLDPAADHTVLEVGTGSGYQAAILSRLVKTVFSIETIPALADEAARRLQRLGYTNVITRTGDAWYGWPEHAPYNGIIITAATPVIPPPLIEQLKPGGRLVAPVGSTLLQRLTLLRKNGAGNVTTEALLPVAFVPLTGDHAVGEPD